MIESTTGPARTRRITGDKQELTLPEALAELERERALRLEAEADRDHQRELRLQAETTARSLEVRAARLAAWREQVVTARFWQRRRLLRRR